MCRRAGLLRADSARRKRRQNYLCNNLVGLQEGEKRCPPGGRLVRKPQEVEESGMHSALLGGAAREKFTATPTTTTTRLVSHPDN